VFIVLVIGFALAIAYGTTRRATEYGAGGMNASMAAMMAAMGTGLSVGYAAGLLWHLGWANLVGVLAGGLHGLWMGRRWGPMAALEGAGGGVMGGLMGPMLAVMLLYLPTSLVLTAVLMLALQLAFSAGGLFLVAASAGGAVASGWFGVLGRVLGAEAPPGGPARDHYAALGIPADATAAEIAQAFLAAARNPADDPDRAARAAASFAVLSDPVRRARYEAARLEDLACCPPRATDAPGGAGAREADRRPRGKRARDEQARRQAAAALAGRRAMVKQGTIVGLAILALLASGRQFAPFPASAAAVSPFSVRAAGTAGAGPTSTTAPASTAPGGGAAGTAPTQPSLPGLPGSAPAPAAEPAPAAAEPAPADAEPDGQIQEVALTLEQGRYGPELVEVQRGVPVRLSVKAVGDPG